MSFVIVISSKGIEGIKAHINSNNSEIFTWFCEDVWRRLTDGDERTQTPVIIWDNASLRTRKESTEFMKSKRTKRITITLYSPQMSAAKKIIGFIKNKLWKEWLYGKPLSIVVLKEIFDQITPDIWKGWINSSRTEIMNKLTNF